MELKRLDFADDIYSKKKEVDQEEIRMRVGEFKDPKLRMGVELLLSGDANVRKQVYSVWGIDNLEQHFLVPVGEEEEAGK